jgi:hypothetical protein
MNGVPGDHGFGERNILDETFPSFRATAQRAATFRTGLGPMFLITVDAFRNGASTAQMSDRPCVPAVSSRDLSHWASRKGASFPKEWPGCRPLSRSLSQFEQRVVGPAAAMKHDSLFALSEDLACLLLRHRRTNRYRFFERRSHGVLAETTTPYSYKIQPPDPRPTSDG